MHLSKIEINGIRGFSTKQTIDLAIPDGKLIGSGFTIIVGPNNSGKSTIIEALNAFTTTASPSFTEGKRNINNKKVIEIVLHDTNANTLTLKTIGTGGSETEFINHGIAPGTIKPFIVPSRRTFPPYFNKSRHQRDAAIASYPLPAQRGLGYNNFAYRLFEIQVNPGSFNTELEKVLGYSPTWNIELSDTGQYYLKFIFDNSEHNSDGAGEGLLSIFTIVDALYDSKPGDIIVIDEPELSVHPSLQKKLLALLVQYAKDRQIIISTHSPYFIHWKSIINGGKIVRVAKQNNSSEIYQLSRESVENIRISLGGINNPHLYGLVTNEVFFLNENVILVEGQEDVVIYKKILEQLDLELKGDFYGWGVGGANNMTNIVSILNDLGFKKVVGILDQNKSELIKPLSTKFPDYSFVTIPADDVRDKKSRKATTEVIGLANTNGILKEKYKGDMTVLFYTVNEFLK